MRFVEDGAVIVVAVWCMFGFFWFRYRKRRQHPDALEHIHELEEQNVEIDEFIHKIQDREVRK